MLFTIPQLISKATIPITNATITQGLQRMELLKKHALIMEKTATQLLHGKIE